MTYYQLNSTFKGVVFFRARPLRAFTGAALMSRHPICFFIVMFFVLYGSISGLGLACLQQILRILVSISINLLTIQLFQGSSVVFTINLASSRLAGLERTQQQDIQ